MENFQRKVNHKNLVLSVEEHKLVDKLHAHKVGLKHYAYSVFIFNHCGELLLQKRAENKYHSGGLWTNTCCSHPLSSDLKGIKRSAERRLQEEVGITCETRFLFTLEYKKKCGMLIENEVDFVFTGISNDQPDIDKNEVSDYQWMDLETVLKQVQNYPEKYTEWFIILIIEYYHRFADYIIATSVSNKQ